jgi:S-methylmethionine-dependent homocysteine/selenocysteine methylase
MKKLLTVKNLIEELQKYDKDLPIMVYTEIGEDGDMASKVRIEELGNKETTSYCKADHPFRIYGEISKAVRIS